MAWRSMAKRYQVAIVGGGQGGIGGVFDTDDDLMQFFGHAVRIGGQIAKQAAVGNVGNAIGQIARRHLG